MLYQKSKNCYFQKEATISQNEGISSIILSTHPKNALAENGTRFHCVTDLKITAKSVLPPYKQKIVMNTKSISNCDLIQKSDRKCKVNSSK